MDKAAYSYSFNHNTNEHILPDRDLSFCLGF